MSIKSWVPGLTSFVAALTLLSACGTASVNETTDSMAARNRAEVHLQLAVGYYSRGQFDVAQEEVRKALLIDPNNVDTYNVQGLIYMSQAQPRLAEGSFQRALRISPENPEVLNNYGWFMCQSGRERDALDQFAKILQNRAYPNQARVLVNAGICSLRLNDLTGAEAHFVRAFELDPGSQIINTNLANVYYLRNQLPRAQFHMSRALKSENLAADTLWLAVRIERKLGNDTLSTGYANQLRRRHPQSPEFAAYLRGAFDE